MNCATYGVTPYAVPTERIIAPRNGWPQAQPGSVRGQGSPRFCFLSPLKLAHPKLGHERLGRRV